MSDAAPITLVAPDGQRYDVPATGVAQLKAKGFRDLNQSERNDLELQKKYGEGIFPAAGAAAIGAADTLTFGGASLAATALGGEGVREALNESVNRNPGAHTAGAVIGLGLPLVGPALGAGKAAAAASSAITGVGKAASVVGDVARGATEAIGLGRVAPIVGGAATAATEGAAFQVGANIGEASRRNAKLDAETLLAHVGEAAVLGAGVGAALPAAATTVRWSAEKALAGLETGVQGLRKLGFGAAGLGVDAVEAGAGAVARNADAIGEGIAAGARGAAGIADKGAAAVVGKADAIGGAVEGAANKAVGFVDDKVLPKIREGLIEQTERPDIINEVFADGAAARAVRKDLGPQTLTGTREAQTEELSKSLNSIWKSANDGEPMVGELASAAKRDLQASALAESPLTRQAQRAVVEDVLSQATTAIEKFAKVKKLSADQMQDALNEFAKSALKNPSSETLYTSLDQFKRSIGKLAEFDKAARRTIDGAGAAADIASDFYGFAKRHLEDAGIWGGTTAALQQEVNAVTKRHIDASRNFRKVFGAKGEGNAPISVLDGKKIQSWGKDITGPRAAVANAVVDDLVQAQRDLVELTERLAKRSQEEARATLGSSTASEAARARAAAVEAAPERYADILNRSSGQIEGLAATKATATKAIDRAEVLQAKQSAILSRQGAGVNPLPVELAQRIGGGALVGGAIGGVPGAIVGGGITSVLQKYGAITSNPKSAIEFLNTVDRLRGVDKKRVADWIRATLGETSESGARGSLSKLAREVDGKAIGASVKRGAEAIERAAPGARKAISEANDVAASKILQARGAAERGIESLASRLDAATPGIMRRILPAVSYADVVNSTPEEWWKRTQKAIAGAQANPAKLLDQLEKDVSGISETLPGTAQAIQQQQLQVLGYLTERMPRNPRPYMLGDGAWTPDPTEMKAFRDLVLVATKPDALLPLITVGTASQAQIDAVKTLWPAKFEETRSQVVSAVMEAAAEGHPVSYEARLRLGQLLGTPLDASQEPGFGKWIDDTGTQAAPQDAEATQQPSAVKGDLDLKADLGLPFSARNASRK